MSWTSLRLPIVFVVSMISYSCSCPERTELSDLIAHADAESTLLRRLKANRVDVPTLLDALSHRAFPVLCEHEISRADEIHRIALEKLMWISHEDFGELIVDDKVLHAAHQWWHRNRFYFDEKFVFHSASARAHQPAGALEHHRACWFFVPRFRRRMHFPATGMDDECCVQTWSQEYDEVMCAISKNPDLRDLLNEWNRVKDRIRWNSTTETFEIGPE